MDSAKFQSILSIGENVAVEFKRCGNGIEDDVYQSVCSFLNRFGGDIFMGVLDNGIVCGVPPKAAPDMIRNFISVMSNPKMFTPTIYLAPELLIYEGKSVIHVHVSPSAEVHSFKKDIYDRVEDADVKVTATAQIAQLYIRKQNIFTEKKIFPYATEADLRMDLLPRVRQLAVNHAGGRHPWEDMTDQEFFRSAGLYGVDIATGERGYNLAAILLLGKDDVILNVCPAYETDALVRRVNLDRYDDREVIRTNLVESFEQLMEFGRKHLSDKFFLEEENRVSLRNILVREMVSNVLMHREFTSTYAAKFVIQQQQMYVENANRAVRQGIITPDSLEPDPKNPIIASFFRNIGRADRLGSGVRNLFKYSRYYSGQEPQFIEGDVFKIIVPLDESYSYAYSNDIQNDGKINGKISGSTDVKTDGKISGNTDVKTDGKHSEKLSESEQKVLEIIRENPMATQEQIAFLMGLSDSGVRYAMRKLKEKGVIARTGSARRGRWIIYTGQNEYDKKVNLLYNGKISGSTDVKTDGKISGSTDVKTDGKISGNTDVKTDGKTSGNADVKTDGKHSEKLSESERKVLEIIRENPMATQEQIAFLMGLSNSGVRYAMRKLKEKGVIARTGSARRGEWRIKE